MRKLSPILGLLLASMLAACGPASAGEAPISASKIYIDSDSDRALDKNVVIAPTGTTPATDGLDITAPGGVNVTSGALTVEAGGLAVTGGNVAVTNTTNGEASVTIKNLSAGSSASIALIMQRAISGGTIRAVEWLGASHSSGDGGLRINIPTSQQVEIYSATAGEALARVDDADGFIAPTVTAEDQVIIEGLGSTSAPAIHFTEGTLPADTGFRVDGTTGKLRYRTNSVDALVVDTGFVATPGYFLVTNGAGTLYAESGFTADLSGYAAQFYFVPAGPYWEAPSYVIRSPGVVMTQRTATLEADDDEVDVSATTYLVLDSDSSTATDRTFTLTPGSAAGHPLLIQFDGSGSGAAEVPNGQTITGGAINLTADWTPADGATLSLIFDGTDWVETGRTAP